MSKKIKALVQKYEKDMQFENRFDELKSKLDLIPDSEPSHDVYVIKRKVMPAYVMIIVLLMLVTGIIGLQFGLNTNYVTGPEQVDKVEELISDVSDIYERESVEAIIIDSNTKIQTYIGYKEGQHVLIFLPFYEISETKITISINFESIELSNNNKVDVLHISEPFTADLEITVSYGNDPGISINISRDYALFFNNLGI